LIKWWAKSSESKAEHIAANKERDKRVRAHQLHMQNADKMATEAEQSMGVAENVNANEGLNSDALSQLGNEKQKAKEFVHGRAKQLKSMRSRVRSGRRKASARGRALGF
jgi:hypothetical protein